VKKACDRCRYNATLGLRGFQSLAAGKKEFFLAQHVIEKNTKYNKTRKEMMRYLKGKVRISWLSAERSN
jgi:hypothetical protein